MSSKGILRLVFLSLILLAGCTSAPPKAPAATSAAPMDPATQKKWADFDKTEALYYDIDKQSFKQISCTIDVPTIDSMVQHLRGYLLSTTNEQVTVSDTLANYRMTYNSATGLHTDDPSFDISLKPGVHPADPKRVADGQQKAEAGFKAMIAGVDAQLAQIMRLMQSDKSRDYDLIYVNLTPDGFTMSFRDKKSGTLVATSQTGDSYEGKYTLPDGSQLLRTVHFDRLPDGKLLAREVTDAGTSSIGKSDTRMSLSYQTLGTIMFPAQVKAHSSIDMLTAAHQEVELDVAFEACTIN